MSKFLGFLGLTASAVLVLGCVVQTERLQSVQQEYQHHLAVDHTALRVVADAQTLRFLDIFVKDFAVKTS